jgi:hypothetical protein
MPLLDADPELPLPELDDPVAPPSATAIVESPEHPASPKPTMGPKSNERKYLMSEHLLKP